MIGVLKNQKTNEIISSEEMKSITISERSLRYQRQLSKMTFHRSQRNALGGCRGGLGGGRGGGH